ncbi:hypothetical protein HJFPF1_00551 [Paramyrothecium foliicola]|nr:hypothetical protein HJFPF1_00551 [Paramyrothecium foliicola]
MYGRDSKSRKSVIRMDPDCAVCHAPATMACECEAKGLEFAIKQAEERMMKSIYSDIRKWVRAHAQDYILEYFRLLAERRKAAHTAHMEHIHQHANYYYHAAPHPNQIADAQAALKRGIDEDWQASVQRYPEVLEYFFGLVELTLPADDEPAVKEPPLGNVPSTRKANRRSVVAAHPPPMPAAAASLAPLVPPTAFHPRGDLRPRTPPAMPPMSRRTPGPQDRRSSMFGRPSMSYAPPSAAPQYAPYLHHD